MARSFLFRRVRRALIAAQRLQGIAPTAKALTRRQALLLGGAALAACATKAPAANESVAIVGGGVAGLTVAYRLANAGRKVTLFESSNRLGGRMFTRHNFNADGQFCELGGELVDSNHEALMALARELGVGVQRLAPEGGSAGDLYDIDGRLYTPKDMLDPEKGTGAFLPIAARIARDQAELLDADENWTPRARELDSMSLRAYLDSFRGRAEDWALDLIDLAYLGEYGQPTDRQSALNLVDFIGTETDEDFAVFGDSDEAWRIAGGSSSLTDALAQAIDGRVDIRLRHELRAVSRRGERVSLAFRAPSGSLIEAPPRIVFALPFTRLRAVEGIDAIGLSPEKLAAITTLGYGNNTKLMVGTSSRPWLAQDAPASERLTGAYYSDRGFQCLWETSRGQEGTRGILTNFLAGDAAESGQAAALVRLIAGLAAVAPGDEATSRRQSALRFHLLRSLDVKTRATLHWARHPHTLGSYASPQPGQYTTMLEAAPLPELGGRLLFAGEHTSADFLGFINGAVESGERVAKEVLTG